MADCLRIFARFTSSRARQPLTHLSRYVILFHVDTASDSVQFQAGSFDPWGGPGFEACSRLLNNEFERVFYKNDLSFGVAILNLYMVGCVPSLLAKSWQRLTLLQKTFGGTNWGNLGHPGGYTSYDYGSPISEVRNITREKYSELKLIGNFVKASPSYLEAIPGSLTTTVYTDTEDLTVTPLIGNKSASSFFVLRHSDYSSQESTSYKLKLPTSAGNLTIPQLGGTLTLNGRDSKIHVTDYDVGGTNILYSTAEIFTWKKFADKKVLIVYGGENEHHEIAVSSKSEPSIVEGPESGISTKVLDNSVVIAWDVSPTRRIVKVDDLQIFLLGELSVNIHLFGMRLTIPRQKLCEIGRAHV